MNLATLPVIPQTVPTHDNTMLADWNYCQRLYAIHHHRGWRRKGGSAALNYGSVLHEGLDAYYDAIKEGADTPHALYAAIQAIEKYPFVDPMNDHRTKGRAMLDMKEYAVNYGKDPAWKVLFTETAFEVADEEGFRYGGKIDLAVVYNGKVYGVDHKTTSRFSAYYFDNFRLSPQMMGYTWGTKMLRSGEPVAGVIINTPVIHKSKTEFHRMPIPFSDLKIKQWRETTIANYHEIEKRRQLDPEAERIFDPSIWTPNFHSCMGKYGPCPAFGVCSSIPTNYEIIFKAEFEPNKWDWNDTTGEDD